MRVTELAIKRPAAMTMIIMIFVVLGLFGGYQIGSDLFPKTDVPFVSIVAIYPGAGAEEMENQVVDQLEEAVSSINGLKTTKSWIDEGIATVVLEFTMGTNVDTAAMDAQKAVDAVMVRLPAEVEKPIVQKIDMNADPVVTLAVTGPRPLNQIYEIADKKIKASLQTIPGVAEISIVGGERRQVRVEIDRERMAAYGLAVNQVLEILHAENLNVPSGRLKDRKLHYDVRLVGKFQSLDDIRKLPLPLPTGATVPLQEIATVQDSFADVNQLSRLNRRAAVGLIVQKQSGASIVDTAKGLRAELAVIQKNLPGDIKVIIADDSSKFIQNSLADTKRTLIEGVIMTGLVLLLFLRQWRSLVIVMLAIPTSIVATFMMMYFFGYTFNLLSLMGLSLCVGILVDDSIVVLENIHRHLQMGKSPFQAAVDGRTEIGMAAVAITLSDVVVFGPIAFMQGMVGQFFKQFGLTVVVATLFSLFVSFTMAPMLAALLYKKNGATHQPISPGRQRLARRLKPWGDGVFNIYHASLLWALRNRLKLLAFIGAGVIATLALIPVIGFEFMPKTDQGKFKITVEMPAGSTLEETDRVVRKLEDRVLQIPEVELVNVSVGDNQGQIVSVSSTHLAKLAVVLKPKKERQRTVWQVADVARGWINDYPGVKIKVLEAPMPGLNYMEAPIVVEVRGPDMPTLVQQAQKIREIVAQTPGVTDVTTSWKEDAKPEYQVVINRDRTAAAGLTAGEVAQALRAAVAGGKATRIRLDNKDTDIWVQLQDANLRYPDDLGDITVSNRLGQTYLIKQLATIVPAKGPTEIRHKNREREITILANYKGQSLSTIVQNFETGFARMKMPDGYDIGYDGEIKQMGESNSNLGQALALSIILVYMILVILYESFLTPLIRMLSLPCGIIGALLALFLTGNSLNMMSIIGIIMLDGLAAKNGTLLIDYTNTLMRQGLDLRSALIEAGKNRLRPIFMTSTTMVFGMLPTALALADGAELRKGMGIVLIGGLISSTVLTPILIPVAYTLLEDLKLWTRRKLGRQKEKQDIIAVR